MKPYLEPTVEFFDLTSVPKAIAELWDEWRELDPGTARLIRTAVSRAADAAAGLGRCWRGGLSLAQVLRVG